jgi:subtilisin family serine protease
MRRVALAVLCLLLASSAPAAADTPNQLERQGVRDIIVQREPGLTASERADLRRDADVNLVAVLPVEHTEVVRAAPGRLTEALAALQADPAVVVAEPDAPVRALSNDPWYHLQYSLENVGQWGGTPDADIDAPEAWQRSRGAAQVVAVVDTGVDLDHPDLASRLLTANRYDWVQGDSVPDDANGHGTHVAGIVAAETDNLAGIAGVAPQASILPLRVLDADGNGWTSHIMAAFARAGDLGVPIVNASLGGSTASESLQRTIREHPNTLYVVAAGNDGRNNDATPTYPCAYDLPNIVCVGASDYNDQRAYFSNYGTASVDLFAPGYFVYSTWPWVQMYEPMSGTSMASPHVAGVAALARGAAPSLGTAALKQALLASVDRPPGVAGVSVTGGRLNADGAVAAALGVERTVVPPPPPPPPTPPRPAGPVSGSAWLTVRSGRSRGRRLARVAFRVPAVGRIATRRLRVRQPSGRYSVRLCAKPVTGGASHCVSRRLRARRGRLTVPALQVHVTPGTRARVTLTLTAVGKRGAARTRGTVALGA